MALIDLSLVTTSLMKLLADNINKNIQTAITVEVTPEPPDKVGAVTNKLSLYLYHIAEEPFYKNFEGPGSDPRNIAGTPMGLSLYYILTAHHESATPTLDPLTQQQLMGYALKTLHDYPIIHDGTIIDGQAILQGALVGNDNPIQVIMRPTPPEEAIAFWGAEDQQTARLSAYYEVRVILLEPDEPTIIPAPVLSLGTYLFQLGAAHLELSRSALPFVLPATAGGFMQIVEASPARVSAETPNDPNDPIRNRLTLAGHNLLTGKRRQIWLRSERWTATAPPAGTAGPIPLDLDIADNVTDGWALTTSESELTLDIGPTLTFINASATETPIAVVPGIYTVFLRVTLDERIVAGTLVPITSDSNEVAVAVIPRIDNVATAGTNRLTVTIVETFDLEDPELDIRLIIAGEVYVLDVLEEEETSDDAGLFEVASPTALTVQALFDTNVAADHAIRLIVNGAESAPHWIELS